MKLIPLLFIAIVSSFSRAVVIEDLADLSVCDLFAASATLELDIQTAKNSSALYTARAKQSAVDQRIAELIEIEKAQLESGEISIADLEVRCSE
jgi:hypothetical protein